MSPPRDTWLDELISELEDQPLYQSHVLVYEGYDLFANHEDFGAYQAQTYVDTPCRFCGDVETCLLTDTVLADSRRLVHHVSCGNCGAHGPWGRTESQALRYWAHPLPAMLPLDSGPPVRHWRRA